MAPAPPADPVAPAPAASTPEPVESPGPQPSRPDLGDAGGAGCNYVTADGVGMLFDFGDPTLLGMDGATVTLTPGDNFPRDRYEGGGWVVEITEVGASTSACPEDPECESWFTPVRLTATGPGGVFTGAVRRVCGS